MWLQAVRMQKLTKVKLWRAAGLNRRKTLKKALIVLVENLTSSFRLNLAANQAEIRRKLILKHIVVAGWRHWAEIFKMNRKNREIRDFQVTITRKTIAWARLNRGIAALKRQKKRLSIADNFAKKRFKQRAFRAFLSSFRRVLTEKWAKRRANGAYEQRNKGKLLVFLVRFAAKQQEKDLFYIQSMQIGKTSRLFHSWSRTLHTPKSSLLQKPASFLYLSYHWLLTFTYSQKHAYSPFSTDPIPLPRCLPPSYQLVLPFQRSAGVRRCAVTRLADSLLQTWVTARVWKAWKGESRRQAWSRGHYQKTIKRHIMRKWSELGRIRGWKRTQIETFRGQSRRKLCRDIVEMWKSHARKQLQLSSSLASIRVQVQAKLWLNWRNRYYFTAKRRTENELSAKLQQERYVNRPWKAWRERLEVARRKDWLKHTAAKYNFQRRMELAWERWRKQYFCRVEMQTLGRNFTQNRIKRTGKLLFCHWKKAMPILRRKNQLTKAALSFKFAQNIAKALKLLSKHAEKRKLSKQKAAKAQQQRQQRLKCLSLLDLGSYSAYRREQRRRDGQALAAVKRLRVGQYLRRWGEKVEFRGNCRSLGSALLRLQRRCTLRTLLYHYYADRDAEALLQTQHRQQAKLTLFLAWKHLLQKQARLRSLRLQVQTQVQVRRLAAPFEAWRSAGLWQRRTLQVVQTAVELIKREVLRQCWTRWQRHLFYLYMQQHSLRYRLSVLAQQCLDHWKAHTLQMRNLQQLQLHIELRCQQSTVKQLFYTWMVRAIKKEKRVFSYFEVRKALKKHTFEAWKAETLWKPQSSTEFRSLSTLRGRLLKANILRCWRRSAVRQATAASLQHTAKQLYVRTGRKLLIAILRKYRDYRKGVREVEGRIGGKVKRAAVGRAYWAWKEGVQPARRKAHAVEIILGTQGKALVRKLLRVWAQTVQPLLEIRVKFRKQWENRQKLGVFQSIQTFQEQNRRKQGHIIEINHFRTRLRAIRVLKSLKANTSSSKLVKEHSQMFTLRQKQKTVLSAWRGTVQNSKIYRGLLATAADFARKGLGKALLKHWVHRTKAVIAKRNVNRAAKSHYSLYWTKTVLSHLQDYSEWKRSKSKTLRQIDTAYSTRLQGSVFAGWRMYTALRKEEKNRLVSLFSTLQSQAKARIAKAVLSAWTDILQMSNSQVLQHHCQRNRSKQQLVLACWAHWVCSLQQERHISLYLTTSLSKRTKEDTFRYWRQQRLSSFQLRKLVYRRKRKVLKRNLQYWRQRLKLHYSQANIAFAGKVAVWQSWKDTVLRGLQAQRVLSRVRDDLRTLLGRAILQRWKKGCCDWRVTRQIEAIQLLRRQKTCWNSWKSALSLQSRITTFRKSLTVHRISHYYHHWQYTQTNSYLRSAQLAKLLLLSLIRTQQKAFSTWQSNVHIQNCWTTLQLRVVFPAQSRLLSLIFLTWRYESHRKAVICRVYQRYRLGKDRQLMRSVIQAFRTRRRSRMFSETLARDRYLARKMRLKRKLLKKWKLYVEKRVNLSDFKTIIERSARKRDLHRCSNAWISHMKRIQSFRILFCHQSLKAAFSSWSSTLTTHRQAYSLARLQQVKARKLTSQAFALWLAASSFLSDLAERVDLHMTQRKNQELRIAMRKLSLPLRIPKGYRWVSGKLGEIRAKRWLEAFKKGCGIAHIQVQHSCAASAHFRMQLLWKTVSFWRMWRLKKTEHRAKTSKSVQKAGKHYAERLCEKGFAGLSAHRWACARLQGSTRRHSVFSAWRQHTREMLLLKKYLIECKLGRK